MFKRLEFSHIMRLVQSNKEDEAFVRDLTQCEFRAWKLWYPHCSVSDLRKLRMLRGKPFYRANHWLPRLKRHRPFNQGPGGNGGGKAA